MPFKCSVVNCRSGYYSTSTLRFALQLRITSNAAYKLLRQYLPLPSQRLLRCLKSDSIDSTCIKAILNFVRMFFWKLCRNSA